MYKRKMTVADMIEELKKMPQDAIIAVAYRDGGGLYGGCDYYDIEPIINDDPYIGERGIVII